MMGLLWIQDSRAEGSGIRSYFDSFGLSRDCKERSLSPLGVEYKPQWRPRHVAPRYGSDRIISRTLDQKHGSERLLLGQRAALFQLEISIPFLSYGTRRL